MNVRVIKQELKKLGDANFEFMNTRNVVGMIGRMCMSA